MLATKGVPPESYIKDGESHRFGLSPFLHYPDLCTIFTDNEEGECWTECHNLEENQRPCWMRAHGQEPPPPETSEEEASDIRQRLEKLVAEKSVDSDVVVALDALIDQASRIQAGDKQQANELRRLVKSMVLLRARLTGENNEANSQEVKE